MFLFQLDVINPRTPQHRWIVCSSAAVNVIPDSSMYGHQHGSVDSYRPTGVINIKKTNRHKTANSAKKYAGGRYHSQLICWTYSHHCQIADKNPSKRWSGIFLGFRICIGFVQRDFVLWVFVCSVNFSLFSGYHAEGYHARTDTFKLTGYHICRVTTPELPRSMKTSGYRRVITPAGSF